MLLRKLEALRSAPNKSTARFSSPLRSLSRSQKAKRRQFQATRAATSDASRSTTTSTSMTSTTTEASTSTSFSSSPSPSPSPPPAPPLPTTYRRLVARVPSPTFREAARVEELPLSVDSLREGQVLVRVAVAGVNSGCETFRVRAERGTPFERAPGSGVPLGAEGAGTVVAVGPGVRPNVLKVGDRVTVNGGSAFAEFVAVGARACFEVPSTTRSDETSPSPSPSPVSLSPAKAVALSLSGLTAAVALRATAKVQRGETVLVTAAAGGTGHLAVQLAALAGCRVVAVAGGERKAQRLRRELRRIDPEDRMGHVVVDYKSGRAAAGDLCGAITEALKSGTEEKKKNTKTDGKNEAETENAGGGIDVVYEGVGGDVRRAALRNLSRGARVLSVGYIGSYPHTSKYKKSEGGGEGKGEKDDTDVAAVVEVSGPGGAEPRGEISLPPESVLFWQRRVVDLPGDRTLFGDVWSGAAGDPKTLARLRKELFASALRGEIIPWIDDEDGDDEDGDDEESSSSSSSSPSSSAPGPRFVGLEAASDAVERLLSGESVGKVVLRVSEGGGDEW